jgi:hypothetical protein
VTLCIPERAYSSNTSGILPFEQAISARGRGLEIALAVSILDAEAATGIGPLNIIEHVANDSTCAAFHTALVRENHSAVVMWNVTIRGATINALLAHTLQAHVAIYDANVSTRTIDVVDVERQFFFDRRGVEDAGSRSSFNRNSHQLNPRSSMLLNSRGSLPRRYDR